MYTMVKWYVIATSTNAAFGNLSTYLRGHHMWDFDFETGEPFSKYGLVKEMVAPIYTPRIIYYMLYYKSL